MQRLERKPPHADSAEWNLSGELLLEELKTSLSIDFATGLPCGELREFIRASSVDKEVIHVRATNERESVGIAVGAWLGGKKPVLYMQNSGLFECSNDLGSLMVAAQIPAVFVVSWRGAPGETASQHFATGSATIPLLESFQLPFTITSSVDDLAQLRLQQDKTNLPVFILKTREEFNSPQSTTMPEFTRRLRVEVQHEDPNSLPSRESALNVINSLTPHNSALFSSTGLISRSLYHHHDSPNQFYNAGAFGLTSSIALGFSLVRPDVPTIVVEGDGSVLTNLGNLNLIGYHKPINFLHIVLDNASYASCSGEPTIGSELIPEIAAVSGYGNVFSITSLESLAAILNKFNGGQLMGANLINLAINQQGERQFKRPLGLPEISRRFRNHFMKQ